VRFIGGDCALPAERKNHAGDSGRSSGVSVSAYATRWRLPTSPASRAVTILASCPQRGGIGAAGGPRISDSARSRSDALPETPLVMITAHGRERSRTDPGSNKAGKQLIEYHLPAVAEGAPRGGRNCSRGSARADHRAPGARRSAGHSRRPAVGEVVAGTEAVRTIRSSGWASSAVDDSAAAGWPK